MRAATDGREPGFDPDLATCVATLLARCPWIARVFMPLLAAHLGTVAGGQAWAVPAVAALGLIAGSALRHARRWVFAGLAIAAACVFLAAPLPGARLSVGLLAWTAPALAAATWPLATVPRWNRLWPAILVGAGLPIGAAVAGLAGFAIWGLLCWVGAVAAALAALRGDGHGSAATALLSTAGPLAVLVHIEGVPSLWGRVLVLTAAAACVVLAFAYWPPVDRGAPSAKSCLAAEEAEELMACRLARHQGWVAASAAFLVAVLFWIWLERVSWFLSIVMGTAVAGWVHPRLVACGPLVTACAVVTAVAHTAPVLHGLFARAARVWSGPAAVGAVLLSAPLLRIVPPTAHAFILLGAAAVLGAALLGIARGRVVGPPMLASAVVLLLLARPEHWLTWGAPDVWGWAWIAGVLGLSLVCVRGVLDLRAATPVVLRAAVVAGAASPIAAYLVSWLVWHALARVSPSLRDEPFTHTVPQTVSGWLEDCVLSAGWWLLVALLAVAARRCASLTPIPEGHPALDRRPEPAR